MNEQKLNDFLGRVMNDLGGAYAIGLVQIGSQLGIYKTLHERGPMTSVELAEATGLAERYLREWLSAHAAARYFEYDQTTKRFALPPEHAPVLVDETSPYYVVGAFDCAAGYVENRPKVQAAFQNGGGVAWGDQPGCVFCAIARFFRPGYEANIVEKWLPALDGVVAKLKAGARVADVGCGHGFSTLIMAEAFPNSEFIGFDFHDASIEEARGHARKHGAGKNVRFEVATAKDFPGKDYDLVTCFDALHDMGDPAGAARHIHKALKPDGAWMIVEPFAHDALEQNINPVGRLYYSASTLVCVPTSLNQEVGTALGAQAGEGRLREVAASGGFRHFRRAAETPFNLILEARR